MALWTPQVPSYPGCRFPVEIIAHCVWLYFRFCLSFRDMQELMHERGVEVSHEGIRLWTLKLGSDYAPSPSVSSMSAHACSIAPRSGCHSAWL